VSSHLVPDLKSGTLSQDGRILAYVSDKNDLVHCLDVTTGDELGQVGWDVREKIVNLSLSPCGKLLAVVDAKGQGKIIPWMLLLGGE
jgi:hypothetical protein